MATHNQARVVGYLLKDPMIQSTDEESKILFKIRTVRRSVEGYVGPNFEDIFVYYDGTEFMEKIRQILELDVNVFILMKTVNTPFTSELRKRRDLIIYDMDNMSQDEIYLSIESKLGK